MSEFSFLLGEHQENLQLDLLHNLLGKVVWGFYSLDPQLFPNVNGGVGVLEAWSHRSQGPIGPPQGSLGTAIGFPREPIGVLEAQIPKASYRGIPGRRY